MSVFDMEHRFLMVNRKFEELYGIRKEEVLGKSVLEVFPSIDNSTFFEFIRSGSQGVPRYSHDYLSRVTNRHYELYTVPLKHYNDVYAVLVVAHDSTDVIESAKRLEEKNTQLVKVNQELEQFAYVASHDLQEPLRKIRVFSSLLEKDLDLDAKSQKYFDKIHLASDRMSRLIKDVLNYSRLSSAEIAAVNVPLGDVLDSVIADFELLIEEKNARLGVSDLPSVRGIPLQLHQLFSNLLSNALKFSGVGPVIQISYRIIAQSEFKKFHQPALHSSYAEIVFADNGIGFEQKFSEQIFTIFQRLHDKETSGTGIGLALCKKIVENHDGFIRVESTPGQGSSFYIYLPLE